MNLSGRVKLVSQLLDLPIIDRDERWCGMVDDVEFEGGAGNETRVKALLVGPGAYEGRLPSWALYIVRAVAGRRMVRVPASQIIDIGSVVKLKLPAEKMGLGKSEDAARAWIPRWGAM